MKATPKNTKNRRSIATCDYVTYDIFYEIDCRKIKLRWDTQLVIWIIFNTYYLKGSLQASVIWLKCHIFTYKNKINYLVFEMVAFEYNFENFRYSSKFDVLIGIFLRVKILQITLLFENWNTVYNMKGSVAKICKYQFFSNNLKKKS